MWQGEEARTVFAFDQRGQELLSHTVGHDDVEAISLLDGYRFVVTVRFGNTVRRLSYGPFPGLEWEPVDVPRPARNKERVVRIEREYTHQLGAEIDVAVSAARTNRDLYVPATGQLVRDSTVTALSRPLIDHLQLQPTHQGWNPDLDVAYIAYGVNLALQGDNGWALFRNLEVVNMENLTALDVLIARTMAGGELPDVLIGRDIIDCGALLLFENKFVFDLEVGSRLEPVVPIQNSVLQPQRTFTY